MHFPVLALITGTVGCLRCLWSLFMEVQWVISEYVFNLTCIYIFLFNFRECVFNKTAAEGALVIRKLYNCNRCICFALKWVIINTCCNVLQLLGRLSRSRCA